MVYLGFEPGTARWLVQTNTLSYGGPQYLDIFVIFTLLYNFDYIIKYISQNYLEDHL